MSLKDGQKQLQFAQSERNKVQSAYDALKKQWEEHFTTCGKGNKVSHALLQHALTVCIHRKINAELFINNLINVKFERQQCGHFKEMILLLLPLPSTKLLLEFSLTGTLFKFG